MTEAYELGQQAFNATGKGYIDSPYDVGTPEYEEWEAGYDEQWQAFIERLDTEMYLEGTRSAE